MSKICAKCGNVIPDGTEICPSCGFENYNEAALQDGLSELGLATDGENLTPIETPVVPEFKDPPETPEAPEAGTSDDTGKKRPGQGQQVRKVRRASDGRRTGSGQRSSSQRRRSMKKSSAAAVGVLIGLIIALLVIVVGVGMLLKSMGFFDPISDEELLGTQPLPTIQATPSPTPSAEPSAEPSQAPEEAPEATPEPTVDPASLLEQFELTSDALVYLYSRGDTATIDYVLKPETLRSQIEWTSDDETIAVVEDGVIQGRRGGTCNITGSLGDQTITVAVSCEFEVADTVLDMNMEDITMTYEGQTVDLAIDYELSQEYLDAIVWESSDPEVADVDDFGTVTAVADGTAVITASLNEYTASCIVRCQGVTGNKGYNSDSSEFFINYEDVTLTRKGEYFQLELSSVTGGSVPSFTWSSSDNAVATVDSKGIVTAVSNGTAEITARVNGDDFRCIVRVSIG